MKTAEKWAIEMPNKANETADEVRIKLIREIQADVLLFAQEQLMESTTQAGALNKIMAAMPNVES